MATSSASAPETPEVRQILHTTSPQGLNAQTNPLLLPWPPPHANTTPLFIAATPISKDLCPRSSLRPDNWRQLLKGYPDQRFPKLLADIATFGARVGYDGPLMRIRSINHPSVLRIPQDITKAIMTEAALGRIRRLDPFDLPAFYYVSPLGAVEKVSAGRHAGWRRIHDLSYPAGRSVNDGISEGFGTLSYQTLDDAIHRIERRGRLTMLRKRDLKDAFRFIPISPLDHWLFLFEWKGSIYVDLFLPFGLRTAPFLFNLFGEGLHWILEWVFQRDLTHYLDDFLLIGDPDPEFFGQLADHLGLCENIAKREDGFRVSFTGIELDTEAMQARLPADKHLRAMQGVQQLLSKGRISHRTLEKLLGFLSFCARVIPLGRPFLRNVFTMLRSLSHLHPFATRRLSTAARRDLQWWATLLPHWSGIRIINPARRTIMVHTDASGVKGIGGWWATNAFSARIPRSHRQKHINWKEAYAVLYAIAIWGDTWKGHTIVMMCDNFAVVRALNNRTIRGDAIHPLQLIFLAAALFNIDLLSEWLPTKENWIADALSRFELDKVADLFPQLLTTRRSGGTPVSTLKKKLQSYFGMASLPQLAKTTELGNAPTRTSASTPEKSHTPHPFRPFPTGSQAPTKSPRTQFETTSSPYAATMLTMDSQSMSSLMKG